MKDVGLLEKIRRKPRKLYYREENNSDVCNPS